MRFFHYLVLVTGMFALLTTGAAANAPIPSCAKSDAATGDEIHRARLSNATLGGRTSDGNYVIFAVQSGDQLLIKSLTLYDPEGIVLADKSILRDGRIHVRSSFSFDFETQREQTDGADFWWYAPTAGDQRLKPQNGARFHICPTPESTVPVTSGGSTTMDLPENAGARFARANGMTCDINDQCTSKNCADNSRCAPATGTGAAGGYCHADDQCASGSCACLSQRGNPSYCSGWEDLTSTILRDQQEVGEFQCRSAASLAITGRRACNADGDCLHYQRCENSQCRIKPGMEDYARSLRQRISSGDLSLACRADSDCRADQRCNTDIGFCEAVRDIEYRRPAGSSCSMNSQCASGLFCADGQRCAPIDGTGQRGAYCHHDNHCKSKACTCPLGEGLFGFCANWEEGQNRGMCE